MKKLLFALVFVFPLYASVAAQGSINLMTYNIRLNTSSDGDHAWPNRKNDVANQIRFHGADIFCLQEVLHDQMMDVVEAFPDYGYVGVGRDDGKTAGEYAPIFYDKDKYSEMDHGYFWLSQTPDKPSKGWDAACVRICSWIQLKDKNTDNDFFVFNTHFDHVGRVARSNSASLILGKIKQLAYGRKVVLCGDFNLAPTSDPIQKMSAVLKDSYTVSELPPHGTESTFLGFTYDHNQGKRIDYVFVSKDVRVKRYGALTDSRDKSFFSDHVPVLVELKF